MSMLEEVRKSKFEVPKPSKEEQEVLDKMKAFIEEFKAIKGAESTDSDADDLVSARFAPESTMPDGTLENTMEVAMRPIDAPPSEAVIDFPISPSAPVIDNWGSVDVDMGVAFT